MRLPGQAVADLLGELAALVALVLVNLGGQRREQQQVQVLVEQLDHGGVERGDAVGGWRAGPEWWCTADQMLLEPSLAALTPRETGEVLCPQTRTADWVATTRPGEINEGQVPWW